MGPTFHVVLDKMRNFTESRQDKLHDATDLLEKILVSTVFYESFLKQKFVADQGKSTQKIYDMLMSGANDIDPKEDHVINLDITYYYSWWSRVIGYGLPDTIRIWTNGKYFDGMKLYELAGHIAHEYTHKLSFIDPDRNMTQSVPYMTGELVESIGKRYMSNLLKLDVRQIYMAQNA